MNWKWNHKITPIKQAKEIVALNSGCFIEVSHGSRMGYHIMIGNGKEKKVLCRISKSTFKKISGEPSKEQSPFINISRYEVSKEIEEMELVEN